MSRRLLGRVRKLEQVARTVDFRAMSDEQLDTYLVDLILKMDATAIARVFSPAAGATDAVGTVIDIKKAVEEGNADHIRRVLRFIRERGVTQDVIRILRKEFIGAAPSSALVSRSQTADGQASGLWMFRTSCSKIEQTSISDICSE